jgi:galactonate dehydratase
MKIQSFKTYLIGNPWKRWLFLELETSTGILGISEATLYQESAAVMGELEEKKDFFVGKDPRQIEKIWNDWYRDSFSRNISAVNVTAMSAVETACWDIVGKTLGVPIYELLGGPMRPKVKVYANGWYTHATTPEDFARKAKVVVERGYRALKFDPFGTMYLSGNYEQIRHAVEVIRAVREAVGDATELLIEGHGRFTPEAAIRIAQMIEEYNPRWFEEPVPPDDVTALKKVSEKTTIPIATGERAITKYGFAPLLESGAVDIIQPDLINCGGLMEGKKISAMAEAHYVTVAPHQAEGPVATATCLQLDACIPNFEIQEAFDEFDVDWRQDILKEKFTVENGEMSIPNRPGLGIELNRSSVEEHLVTEVRNDFNLFQSGWENRNLPKR